MKLKLIATKLDRTLPRRVLVAAAVTVGSGAVAFLLIFALMRPADTGPRVPTPVVPQGEDTSGASADAAAPSTPTAPYTIESTLPPGMTPEDVAADAASPDGLSAAFPRVAFVHEGQLKVVDESGGGEHVISGQWEAGGTYALSPDRKWIAYGAPDPDMPRAGLYVVRIGGTARRVASIAKGNRIAWFPDGKRLVATLVETKGRKVAGKKLGVIAVTGGSAVRFELDGRNPAVSPGGRQLIFMRPVGLAGATIMELWRIGASGEGAEPVLPGLDVSDADWLDEKTLVVAERGSGSRGGRLLRVRPDGRGVKELAKAPSELTSLNRVLLGGDGGMLAYDVVGDDGYSRIRTIRADGQGERAMPGKLDVYPMCWGVDGDRLFFIEGNASQGEPTALVSAGPTGKGKHFVVLGARR